MPKYGTFTSFRGSAAVRRIVAVGIAVLIVVTLTEGCRKTTTGTQNPPTTQVKQPMQQPSPQWQQANQQHLQGIQQMMTIIGQTQEQQHLQELQIRAIQEQQRLQELQMRAAQEKQWFEWSRNYYISQISPKIKESFAYLLAQIKLIGRAIDTGNYFLLSQITTTDITFLINLGIPANFYPPQARDLLLSAEGDLKRICRIHQYLAAKIFTGTIVYNPAELISLRDMTKSYLLSAAQKISAAELMLGVPSTLKW